MGYFFIKTRLARAFKTALNSIMSRAGFIKMPGAWGGSIGAMGLSGCSNLGSPRRQCEAYQNHVYKCVTLIYRRAISIPMKLYKRQGKEKIEIKRHPFIDLIYRPNPYMSISVLKAITFMHRDLTGRAFWLLKFNRLGRPAEIWPLPAANFSRFVFNQEGSELLGYEFSGDGGGNKVYAASEVVYFRYPHPLNPFEGASPIQAMAFAYDTDMAIRTYQRNFFQNSARADVVLQTDQKIQPEDARRLLIGWKENHQGVKKAFEPALLDQGLKAQILSVPAKDLEFAALAAWTKQDILEAYNVPEGKLGTVTDVNRANGIQLDITFNSECIKPRLMSFDEDISKFVLPFYDDTLYVKHANCVPRDREFEIKERDVHLEIYYTTINEERKKRGLKSVPWGNSPWMPISMVQARSGQPLVRGANAARNARTRRG